MDIDPTLGGKVDLDPLHFSVLIPHSNNLIEQDSLRARSVRWSVMLKRDERK